LSAAGVGNSLDLGVMTSSLSTSEDAGYYLPRLRGIGTSSFGPGIENAVASYIDGVYIASAPASLFTLNNISRIEVLKGPQGTLFGRNATGGVIHVISEDPQAGLSGNANVSYGNFQTAAASGYLTGGSDLLAVNLAAQGTTQGEGYGRNLATGGEANRLTSDVAARSTALFKPGASTEARLSLDYASRRGSFPWFRQYSKDAALFGPPAGGSPWDTSTNVPTTARLKDAGGVSLRINQKFSAMELVSITAYRLSTYDYYFDYDITPTPALSVVSTQKDRQFSQEVQLVSRSDDPLRWVAGVYYFWGEGRYAPSNVFMSGPAVNPALPLQQLATTSGQTANSIAGFGQATLAIAERNHLTVGVRYTNERRELTGTTVGFLAGGLPIGVIDSADKAATFSKMTWRVALDRQLSDDVMGYVSYNRGFKSGGFNASLLSQPAYKPELIDAYEIGIKSDLLEQRLRVNPSVFYYDYSNIQVPFFTNTGQIGIANGPSAEIYGLDMDVQAVVADNLRLTGGLTYLHDRFDFYPDALYNIPLPTGGSLVTTGDATDHQLPFTSKLTATLGVDYTKQVLGGELSLNVNALYNDGFYSEVDNLRRQGSYPFLNSSLKWTSPGNTYHVSLWGKNLTNEAIVTTLAGAQLGTAASYQPPRTYGITAGATF
jgi:iron complex outermembrane receptor protein